MVFLRAGRGVYAGVGEILGGREDCKRVGKFIGANGVCRGYFFFWRGGLSRANMIFSRESGGGEGGGGAQLLFLILAIFRNTCSF